MFFVVTFDDILYMCHQATGVNSLAPMEFEWNLRHVIFKRILVIGGWGISCEIALIWISLDFTYDSSTLVQVSLYLSQCSPRSLSPYGVTMPQWVKAAICCGKIVSCSIYMRPAKVTRLLNQWILQRHQGHRLSHATSLVSFLSGSLYLHVELSCHRWGGRRWTRNVIL